MKFKCYIPNHANLARFTVLEDHMARLRAALVSPDTVELRDRLPQLAGLPPARFFQGLPDEPPVYIFRPLHPPDNQSNQGQSLRSILHEAKPKHIWLAGGLGKTTAMLHALWERCLSDSACDASWIPCWLHTGPSNEDTFWYRLEDTLRVPNPLLERLAHSPPITFFVDLDSVEGLEARARLVASIAGVALAHRYSQHRFVVAYRPTDDVVAKELIQFTAPWQVASLSIEKARAEWQRRGYSQERAADLAQFILKAWAYRARQDELLLVDWEWSEAMTRREFLQLGSLTILSSIVRVPRGLVTPQSMADAAGDLIESLKSTTRTVYVPSDYLDEPERNFMYGRMLAQQGHWREALLFFERAAEQWPLDSRGGRARIEAAQQWINLGNYEAAEKKLDKVLGADRYDVDALTRARALDKMGWAKHYQGLYDTSIQLFGQALREAQKYDDKPLEADALHFIARNFYSLAMESDNKEALRKSLFYFNKAHYLARQSGSPEGVLAHHWRWQARVLEGLGEIDEARKLRVHAFQVFKDEPGRYGTAHILRDEGRDAFRAGQCRQAEKDLYEALDLWEEIRYAKGLADCLSDLARGYWEGGEPAKLDDIVDLALAALLVYPYPGSLAGRSALDILQAVQHERIDRFSEHIVQASDRVVNKTGPFRLVSRVERTIDVESVRQLLAQLLGPKRGQTIDRSS